MKKLCFLLLLLLPKVVFSQFKQSVSPEDVCCSDTLIINTGYDPVGDSALPSGADGGTPVVDPKWIVASISPSAVTAIAAMSYTAVTPGNNADVISRSSTWAVNPVGHPGNWISCLNGNGFNTPGSMGSPIYYATLSRPFTMCNNDIIKLSFYLVGDNYISGMDIDGTTPLSFSQPVGDIHANYATFTYFTTTVWLPAGVHKINIEVQNYTSGIPGNGMGIEVYGTLTSSSGKKSIKEEKPDCDTIPLFSSIMAPSAYLHIFPNPVANILSITSNDQINTVAINNCIGQTLVYSEYYSNKVEINVAHLPKGIYFVKINGAETRKFVKE